MDDDIVDILCAAWRRVRETLRGKPEEVRRRLRRGREMWRKRPPRAWCLAIRASDTRINPVTARCEPEHAAYPRDSMPGERQTAYARHRVTITVDLLRDLIRPVRIHEWGEEVAQVARRLGRGEGGLTIARFKGRVRTHFDPPTGGRGGPPRAIVSASGWLDPGAHLCAQADPVWGWTGKIAYWRVPDELEPQTIERVPFYQDRTRAYADTSGLHPEHPLVDPPPRKRGSPYKLGKPVVTDNAQYKWCGEEYLGYDWRAAEQNPQVLENYVRRQLKLEKQRAAHQARRARGVVKPRPGAGGGGSLLFRGWMWICPVCGKQKKVLYYPLPPVNVIRGYGCYVPDDVIEAAIAREPELGKPMRASGLACKMCHGIRWTSRASYMVWSEIVTYLSGGLLWGREAPRPAWFTPDRKRPYRPCLGREPSRRLAQVEALMHEGVAYKEIARRLGLRKGTIGHYAWKVLKRHGARSRAELENMTRRPAARAVRPSPDA